MRSLKMHRYPVGKIILYVFLATGFFFGLPAYAHRVNIVAYIEGDTAFTESYFQDGGSVVKGKIEVYDSFHNLLLTGVTGEEGEFSFANPRLDDLTVVLEAALGHRATCTLTPDESHTGITREDTRSENRGTSY